MSSLASPHAHVPALRRLPTWRALVRRLFRRLLALDALQRERRGMASLDPRMLRDIGVTRADVEATLSRPDEHLRLILLRGQRQF